MRLGKIHGGLSFGQSAPHCSLLEFDRVMKHVPSIGTPELLPQATAALSEFLATPLGY